MANLAIKGHATRGSEVLALLEMLGGINDDEHKCYISSAYYFINDNYIDWCHECTPESEFICFSLEEFFEKYPYKIGDKVKYNNNIFCIKSSQWDSEKNTVIYYIDADWSAGYVVETNNLQPYKEETMEEKLVCNEIMSSTIDTSKLEKRKIIFSVDAPNETELVLGDNFEIKVEDGKIYIVRKKPQYPKTYKECCEVIGLTGCMPTDNLWYKFGLILAFYQLLICRDAYWKIAGEWMGLSKPWWYDMSKDEFSYAISYQYGHIQKNEIRHKNAIFVFPVKEMRDAFYENFKDLIEQCKELL